MIMLYWIGHKLILENEPRVMPLPNGFNNHFVLFNWKPAYCFFLIMVDDDLLLEVNKEMINIDSDGDGFTLNVEYVVHFPYLD